MRKNILLTLLVVITMHMHSNNLPAEKHFDLSEKYFNLIKDPSSWMRYAGDHEKNLILCLELDSNNPKYNLLAAKSMIRFPSSIGSEEDGVKLLYSLLESEPENVDVLITLSKYLLDNNMINEAKIKLEDLLFIDNEHIEAKKLYDSILLAEKELIIREFILENNIKTSQKRVLKKVSSFIGQTFTNKRIIQIKEKLTEISSISDVELELRQVGDKYIDIVLTPDEENMKGLVYIAGSTFSLDYDGDIVADGIPAVMYMDENLFGLGINLELLTAVVFNKIDLVIPGLIDDRYLDLKLSIESMLLPTSNDYYEDGQQPCKTEEHSYLLGSLSLGRSFPFGLDTFINYEAEYDMYKDVKESIDPSSDITHSFSLSVNFTTAEDVFSPLHVKEGFSFSLNPILIYKPNYKPWGKVGELHNHNDKPAYGLTTSLGYYKNLKENHNLSVDLNLMFLENNYESTKYRLGQKTITDDYSLTGYIPSEIATDFGFLSNIKYSRSIVPGRFLIYKKYDFLYDIDGNDFYNGVAVGFGLKLPWDIHMNSEFGFGLNATRDSDFGYSGSLTLSKVVLF